jgi:1-acyl-sn-glycerol-3-phosphate acyltransferase
LKAWFNWRFEGLENVPAEGPALVAANHISYLDWFADAYFLHQVGRRTRFLAKAELWSNSALGRILAGAGQIPVERGTGSPAPLRAAQAALDAGGSVVVYPEGTVTKNPDFSPMEGKTGVARLSFMTGLPVIPLASWGSQNVWQKTGKLSLKFGRPVVLKAGPPVDLSKWAETPEDPDALREATDAVMTAIGLLVEDLRSRYPERWA